MQRRRKKEEPGEIRKEEGRRKSQIKAGRKKEEPEERWKEEEGREEEASAR